jgi:hypothetical protein
LGQSRNEQKVEKFFRKEVFGDMVGLVWARQVLNHKTQLNNLQEKTQAEIATLQNISKKRGLTKAETATKAELKQTLSWVNRRRKRGLQSNTGESGPFKHVYQGLVEGWRFADKDDANADPLKIEDMLQHIEEIEKKMVLA